MPGCSGAPPRRTRTPHPAPKARALSPAAQFCGQDEEPIKVDCIRLHCQNRDVAPCSRDRIPPAPFVRDVSAYRKDQRAPGRQGVNGEARRQGAPARLPGQVRGVGCSHSGGGAANRQRVHSLFASLDKQQKNSAEAGRGGREWGDKGQGGYRGGAGTAPGARGVVQNCAAQQTGTGGPGPGNTARSLHGLDVEHAVAAKEMGVAAKMGRMGRQNEGGRGRAAGGGRRAAAAARPAPLRPQLLCSGAAA